MSRPRDSQVRKVIDAEATLPVFSEMPREQLEAFTWDVTTSRWWRNRYQGGHREKVLPAISGVERYTGSHQPCGTNLNELSLTSRTPMIQVVPERWSYIHVLHSLAHFLAPYDSAAHGPDFIKQYLGSVRQYVGQQEGADLKRILLDFGVKTYTWSDQARQKAKDAVQADRVGRLVKDLTSKEW